VVPDLPLDPIERRGFEYAQSQVEQCIERVGARRLAPSDLRDLVIDQRDEPFLGHDVHRPYLPGADERKTIVVAPDGAPPLDGSTREVVR